MTLFSVDVRITVDPALLDLGNRILDAINRNNEAQAQQVVDAQVSRLRTANEELAKEIQEHT